jgi:pyridinium-3,5-biscarboxylic acid mononucleotide sulfurtransferase
MAGRSASARSVAPGRPRRYTAHVSRPPNVRMTALPPDIAARADRLMALLRSCADGVAVAFSGGIDSTVVAKAASLALGDRAVAVTADSPSVARAELEEARRVADLIGIRHEVIRTTEFDNPDYQKNDGSRCYHCKSELYDQIIARLPDLRVRVVCSGANLDDLGDYRPGLTAAAERHVRHPLQETGFTKADVRALAKAWGLPTWNKPASPCLSSRLAPGLPVTAERTARVEAAEAYLKTLGLHDYRVRLHQGELARIEVPIAEVVRLAVPEVRDALARRFRELGFKFVTLDLEGFRSGSLNELVGLEIKARYTEAAGRLPGGVP